MRDLYEILGLDKSATAVQIKKAYRKLINKHHPDKGGDEEISKEIQKAYDVLSDQARKEKYDLGGGTDEAPDPNIRVIAELTATMSSVIDQFDP